MENLGFDSRYIIPIFNACEYVFFSSVFFSMQRRIIIVIKISRKVLGLLSVQENMEVQ